MRPFIGITPYVHREPPNRNWLHNTEDTFRAIHRAGGIPVLLSHFDDEVSAGEVLERIDGLLLSGGGDVDPQLYGEQPHPKMGAITPERDRSEIALARTALARNMPVFGICRGHQVLAVAAGGTLVQDILSQVHGSFKHYQDAPRWYATHQVKARQGSLLATILGNEFRVNSFHHQAVKNIPAGWSATAVSDDGVNEAMEHPGYRFAVSVQWHPENMVGHAYNHDELFRAFIASCQP
jgi:putative glutamine amidotransferase